jgi:recombination protein RecA
MNKALDAFKKKRDKLPGVTTNSEPPRLWLSTGAYTMNKILSGSYDKGFAMSRMSMVTGPSDSGKSFIAMNAALEAQRKGYGVFIVDSEHALDDNYFTNVGLDVEDDLFMYNDVNSLEAAKKLISEFTRMVRENQKDLPPFVLIVDSLDQLKTKSHVEKASKGEVHNDQGQHAKQLKQFGFDVAHDIKDIDVFGIVTKQPYVNQDPIMSKVKPYIITEAMRFPFSQILLVWNKRVKNKTTAMVDGIELTAFAEKTRFCKPFQKCAVTVPYDTGIDKYSGVLEAAEGLDILSKSGAWYNYEGTKFQKGTVDEELMETIFQHLVKLDEDENTVLDYNDLPEKEDTK